ncbi:MAG: HDIG domain-containing protein [Deltaproteobacteria bacterium]|nr:HDIG domain-containing protein [Deltaproteobacteria bacterium]
MPEESSRKLGEFLRVVARKEPNGETPAANGCPRKEAPKNGGESLLHLRWERLTAWLKDVARQKEGDTWLMPLALGLGLAAVLHPGPWGLSSIPLLVGAGLVAGLFLRLVYLVGFCRLAGMEEGCSKKDLFFFCSLLFFTALVARLYGLFAQGMVMALPEIHTTSLGYGVPLAAGPMLVALFFGAQAGMLMSLLAGFTACLVWPDSVGLFIYFFLTGLVAAHHVSMTHTRMSPLGAGMWAAAMGALLVTGLALMQGWLFSWDMAAALVGAITAGLLSGVLTAGFAPLAEIAFGYISDFRLMELASLDHPVLRELMLNAPGTYHHSLVTSSLVEAAAKEIGANPLLAKVAALYHDLGKMKKPLYFVENQMCGPNRHEKLAPSMSALILISHVKEGVEIARRHRLGQPIIDIIAQHHGTRLIHFFYHKAMEERQKAGKPEPDPEAYRYPGPRPQTREAGLVMLADTVEAATRALPGASPARIQGLVQTQINKVFSEGQLDECELTLKDLHKIAKIFIKILSGIFHQRIEYPETEDKAKKKSESSDRQPAKSSCNQPVEPREPDNTDLRRLGIN